MLIDRKVVNPYAYEAYLKGKMEWNLSNFSKAKEYLAASIALDPGFSEAYGFLSITYSNLSNTAYPLNEKKKKLDSMYMYAKKAMELDINNPISHLAMERVYRFQYDWINMSKEVDRALAINPGGAMEKMRKAVCLVMLDNADNAAISLAKEAAGLDSLNPGTVNRYAYVLYYAGRYDEAISVSNTVLALDPNSVGAYSRIGFCYASKKEYKKALQAWAKQNQIQGNYQIAEMDLKSDFKTAMLFYMEYVNTTAKTVFAREYITANLYAFLRDEAQDPKIS